MAEKTVRVVVEHVGGALSSKGPSTYIPSARIPEAATKSVESVKRATEKADMKYVNSMLAFEKEAIAAQKAAGLGKTTGKEGVGSSVSFIGGKYATLTGKAVGVPIAAAIGALPAMGAILVIAEILKTGMAPLIKFLSAIFKVLGATLLPISMIVIALLRPVLMVLMPILKFMMAIWKPHMLKIAQAAKTLQQTGDVGAYYVTVFQEVIGFFGDLMMGAIAVLGKMLITNFSDAIATVVDLVGKTIAVIVFEPLIASFEVIKALLMPLTQLIDKVIGTNFSTTIEEIFGSRGSGTGIIGGLENSKNGVVETFGSMAASLREAGKTAGEMFEKAIMESILPSEDEIARVQAAWEKAHMPVTAPTSTDYVLTGETSRSQLAGLFSGGSLTRPQEALNAAIQEDISVLPAYLKSLGVSAQSVGDEFTTLRGSTFSLQGKTSEASAQLSETSGVLKNVLKPSMIDFVSGVWLAKAALAEFYSAAMAAASASRTQAAQASTYDRYYSRGGGG